MFIRMTPEAVLDLFRQSGALLEGHFRLTSGLAQPRLYAVRAGAPVSAFAESLGQAIGEWTRELTPTVVLSPALGGVVIGQEVGRALGVRAIFAERQDSALTLRRGFTLGDRDRVLVVEDVLTTGGSRARPCDVATAVRRPGRRRRVDRRPQRRADCVSTCHSRRCSSTRCRPTNPASARCAPGPAGDEAGR